MEATRHAERVQQLEQEKLDSTIAQRKKLEALEISKTNEMEKLQAVHRYSMRIDASFILYCFTGPVLVTYIVSTN